MTDKLNSAPGSKIKALRESKNILPEEVAERSGLDVEFYKSLENNDVLPTLGDLIKVSRVLGVRLGMLLDDYQDEGPIVSRAKECAAGVQGELCNRGYNNMKGYYNNPQATAETIDENGWLHSGDLGYRDEKGNYRITGRIKDMIIRGGENIYPREIEEFLYKLKGVKDVQVAGIPSEKYGEEVGAFIIMDEGADLHESDVREFCKGKIARYKIPKYVLFVEGFPLTGSGKIQKFKLKDIGLQMLKEQGVEVI